MSETGLCHCCFPFRLTHAAHGRRIGRLHDVDVPLEVEQWHYSDMDVSAAKSVHALDIADTQPVASTDPCIDYDIVPF